MKNSKPVVGFDRYVEKAWLDQVATLVLEGNNLNDVNQKLDEYLTPFIVGETSRRKTKNILTATWAKSFPNESRYKQEAVMLFADANNQERIAVHYGLTTATYPFFRSLSRILGRLFKLQEEINHTEFYRRVIEEAGDRESVKRAAARYLQSLLEWGLIKSTGKAKSSPTNKIQLTDRALVTWLYSSALFTTDKTRLAARDLVSDPVWFPFGIPYGSFDYSCSNLIEVVHRDVDVALLMAKQA